MNQLKEIGLIFREARIKRKLGVRQLAFYVEIDPSGISRFESGLRSLSKPNFEKLRNYLRINIAYEKFVKEVERVQCPFCLKRFNHRRL